MGEVVVIKYYYNVYLVSSFTFILERTGFGVDSHVSSIIAVGIIFLIYAIIFSGLSVVGIAKRTSSSHVSEFSTNKF